MSEQLGKALGYMIVFLAAFLFSYLSMGFLAWNWDVSTWDEMRRGMTGLWTMILIALFIFETRK